MCGPSLYSSHVLLWFANQFAIGTAAAPHSKAKVDHVQGCLLIAHRNEACDCLQQVMHSAVSATQVELTPASGLRYIRL